VATSGGRQLLAGRVPGELLDITTQTSDGSGFTTTRADQMSITVPVVSGRTYAVWHTAQYASSAAGDSVIARIWQDSSSGTELQSGVIYIDTTGTLGYLAYVTRLWVAGSTGDQTFVVDAVRSAGSGTCRLEAASNRPAYLGVNYVTG
jgi:hypothetical protein